MKAQPTMSNPRLLVIACELACVLAIGAFFPTHAGTIKLPTPAKALPVYQPQTVFCAWDSPPGGPWNFRLYSGVASRSYTNVVNAGPSTFAQIILPRGVTNYLAATTLTADMGLESAYSTEITYFLDLTSPPPAVVILTLTAEYATNVAGPWGPVTNAPILSLTNPPGTALFRLRIQ